MIRQIVPERYREITFFIFEIKMNIFIFFIAVLWTKNCPVVQ
jgi:hypothetical protein